MKALFSGLVAVLVAPVALAEGLPREPDTHPFKRAQEVAAEAAPVAAPAAAVAAPAATVAPAATMPKPASSVAATEDDHKKSKSGFGMGVSLDHSLGHGTLVRPEYYASFTGGLSFSPGYSFKVSDVKLSASASGSVNWEYTLPDNATGRRVGYSDLRASLSAPSVFKETYSGISMSPSVSVLVPISLESAYAGTITVLSGSLGFSRALGGKVDLSYRFGAGRGFHRQQGASTATPYSANTASQQNPYATDKATLPTCLARPTEPCPFGTQTQFSISNSLGVNVRPLEKLSVSVGLGLTNSFKYANVTEVDEYTPKALDSNGNPVARVGFGRSDSMSGSVSVSYSINDHLGIGAGMSTGGPPRTKDNKNWRFPFFDFVSPEDSLTGYSVSVSANF